MHYGDPLISLNLDRAHCICQHPSFAALLAFSHAPVVSKVGGRLLNHRGCITVVG